MKFQPRIALMGTDGLIHRELSARSLGCAMTDARCVTAFDGTHIAQIIGYLSITGFRLGLLINFKHARLQWKRIVQ